MDLLIKNGLVERADCEHIRYRTTPKGEAALGHMRELEKMMPEGEIKLSRTVFQPVPVIRYSCPPAMAAETPRIYDRDQEQ
jgi:hypothetical protein